MRQLWYVKRRQQVSGPFPLAAIEQDFLLGRLQPQDELSADRITWLRVAEQPELASIVMAQTSAPQDPDSRDWSAERLAALRRWANERTGTDRREQGARLAHPGRREGERREPDGTPRHAGEEPRASPSVQPRGAWRLVVGILALVVIILIAVAYHLGTVVPVSVRLG